MKINAKFIVTKHQAHCGCNKTVGQLYLLLAIGAGCEKFARVRGL